MTTSNLEDKAFNREFFPQEQPTLEDVIDWIQGNLRPEQVFDTDDLLGWAIENGYAKEQ